MKPVREIIKKFKLKNHHYTGGPCLTTIRSETFRSYDGSVKIAVHPIYDCVCMTFMVYFSHVTTIAVTMACSVLDLLLFFLSPPSPLRSREIGEGGITREKAACSFIHQKQYSCTGTWGWEPQEHCASSPRLSCPEISSSSISLLCKTEEREKASNCLTLTHTHTQTHMLHTCPYKVERLQRDLKRASTSTLQKSCLSQLGSLSKDYLYF